MVLYNHEHFRVWDQVFIKWVSSNYHVTPSHAACWHQGWEASFEVEHWIWGEKERAPIPVAQGHADYHLMLLDFSLFLRMKKGWGRTTLNHSPGFGVQWDTEYEWGVRQMHKYKRLSPETVGARVHSLCLSHQKRLTHPSGRTYILHPNLALNQSVSLCLCSYLFQLLMLQRNTSSFVNRAMDSYKERHSLVPRSSMTQN